MSTSMYLLMKDIFASFVCAQFLLPVILAVEWEFDKLLLKVFVIVLTTYIFGFFMYLLLVYFGVSDGISSFGGRDMSMGLELSIGLMSGCCFVCYITKPLFYKAYFSIKKKR